MSRWYAPPWPPGAERTSRGVRLLRTLRQPQELHGPPRRAKAQALIERLRPVFVVGPDPEVADVAGGRDRRPRDGRAAPAAAVLGVHEHLGDLRGVAVTLHLRESDRHAVLVHGKHLHLPAQRDLARLGVVPRRIAGREVLLVPGDTQVVHGVVRDLLDRSVRTGRRCDLVTHHQQPRWQPAARLEAGPQPVCRSSVIEVDAPMCQPGERLVREQRQRVHAHGRVFLHPHHVEVVVARIRRGARNGAVLPRIEDVAHRGMRRAQPAERALRDGVLAQHAFPLPSGSSLCGSGGVTR